MCRPVRGSELGGQFFRGLAPWKGTPPAKHCRPFGPRLRNREAILGAVYIFLADRAFVYRPGQPPIARPHQV